MIQELHIKNLAVIEDITLNFSGSYVALLGETGAGKSLIVASLSLLLGERSDYSLVRDKKEKAIISALFKLNSTIIKRFPILKEYVNDDSLIVKRVLSPDKTTRYYLNDTPVTLNTLKDVTSHLINIHSQRANIDILDNVRQLEYVDYYGGKKIKELKEKYLKSYEKYIEKKNELEKLVNDFKDLDKDYLTYQIKEIEKYDLKENEIEDLNKEYDSLRDFEKLKEKYTNYQQATNISSMNYKDLMSMAIKELQSFNQTGLEESSKQAISALYEAVDRVEEFEDDFNNLDTDPKRLDYINERLFSLKSLMRKYGKSTNEILSKLDEYKEKLKKSDDFEYEKEELKKEIEELRKDSYSKASLLHEERKRQASLLAVDISDTIKDLGLRKNAFSIEINECEMNENGISSCEFYVELNEGIERNTLAKAASGGESSRLMLAIKCVLNHLNPYDVLVLDEIDVGVSGKVAMLVAKKIRNISLDSQVIVISHLPQVVASCKSGIYIKKTVNDGVTKTTASAMDESILIENIASMLSGSKVTDSALEQAKKLREEYTK